ncbi:MAG: SDR family NAD(P)-dependent oxidoreductase [Pseudomonadota bacterium]
MDANKPTVLITGASTGLGLAISRRLMETGEFRLLLTAREKSLGRFQELGITESETLMIRPLDVTNRLEREKVVDEVLKTWGQVDFLINNAGLAYRSVAEHIEPYELVRQMSINFYAPLDLIRLVLPSMRRRRQGHIINISSVSGMMAMPTMGLYSSSKFALEGLSESLWYEVKPWNINVTLVEPGFIQSEAFQNVPWTRKAKKVRFNEACPYHPQYNSMEPFIGKIMRRVLARPDSVAKKVLKVMRRSRPPLRVKATMDAVLFDLMKRFMPASFYHWFLFRSLPNVKNWGKAQVTESDQANFLVLEKNSASFLAESLDFVDSKTDKTSDSSSPEL